RGRRQDRVAVREVAQIRRLKERHDVEARDAAEAVAKALRVAARLHFENVAGDERAVRVEKTVEIVAVDRRAALEAERRRERRRPPKVAPARQIEPAHHAPRLGHQARAGELPDARRNWRHAAYSDK